MSDAKIIAFSGSHGTGKTTAVYALAAELKRQVSGEVGIVLETARQCPYQIITEGHDVSSKEGQLWIFSAQMQAEMDAARFYDVVVSDRTILDCIAYTSISGMHDLAYGMREVAKHYARDMYREVRFRSIVANDFLTGDCFRSTNERVRREFEMALLSLYHELKIKVVEDGH